jgi:drug/metabolite transporter (DMT)-like permease
MDFKTLIRILILAGLWGPSFLLIKLAVAEISPITTATIRVSIGAIFLIAMLKIMGKKLLPFGKIWKQFFIMGLFSNAIPFCLFCVGEMSIDSSMAALINGAPPIFTAMLAHYFLKDEPLTIQKILGICLGISGLLALFIPNLLAGASGSAWGIAAIVLATLCYAIGFVYAKAKLKGIPPLIAPASQLILASLVLIPVSLIFEQPLSMPMPSWTAILALLGLGVGGTGIAFVIFFKVIETAGATAVSMTAYLLPVVGMTLGVLFLDEPMTWNNILGGALILSAMLVVNGAFKFKKAQPATIK